MKCWTFGSIETGRRGATTDWARFAQQMASTARDLPAQTSVDDTLERLTASAVDLVEGCDAAGILVALE